MSVWKPGSALEVVMALGLLTATGGWAPSTCTLQGDWVESSVGDTRLPVTV